MVDDLFELASNLHRLDWKGGFFEVKVSVIRWIRGLVVRLLFARSGRRSY